MTIETDEQIDLEAAGIELVKPSCDSRDCDRPAAWIAWSNHECDRHRSTGLLCNACLELVLTGRAMRCVFTGELFAPARTWLARFERIDHKPTSRSGGAA